MQNNLSHKKLAKLGVVSNDDLILELQREVERLCKLLDEKDSELRAVKKHFEDLFENIINSRSAINPNVFPNVNPGIITYPTTDQIDVNPIPNVNPGIITYPTTDQIDVNPIPNGTGSYPHWYDGITSDPPYPYVYTTGDSSGGLISCNNTISNGNSYGSHINPNGLISNNIILQNTYNVYRIDGEDSDSCDAAYLTG